MQLLSSSTSVGLSQTLRISSPAQMGAIRTSSDRCSRRFSCERLLFSAKEGRSTCKRWKTRAGVDFAPPPIDGDLVEVLLDAGAELDDDGVALSFGNDEAALDAALNGVAVFDMSHFGRIRVTGDDRVRFLHNQTTADFNSMQPGQGSTTVFVNAQARTIDLAAAWIMGKSIILTVSPSQRKNLLTLMDRYIFPADKVELADMTEKTNMVALIGPRADEVLEKIGAGLLVGRPEGSHAHFSLNGSPMTASVGSGLALPGYTLLLNADLGGTVWSYVTAELGAVPMGANAWERLRVRQGRPAAGAELTTEFNPLEAALLGCISITKGCYMGQETIARLITYDGVKQQLWGLQMSQQVEPGASIKDKEGKKIGKLTSCAEGVASSGDSPFIALGYIVKQAGAVEGMDVTVNGVPAKVADIPFAHRSLETVAA